jgi:glycosyltransferase EpsH
MPAISILMPCYNVHQIIEEAISSRITQSLADFEVGAVNDGSTSGTLCQLQKRAQPDQRIRVTQLPHHELISTLKAGFQACKSFCIARMDADDRLTLDRLMRQFIMVIGNPSRVGVSSLGIEVRVYIN